MVSHRRQARSTPAHGTLSELCSQPRAPRPLRAASSPRLFGTPNPLCTLSPGQRFDVGIGHRSRTEQPSSASRWQTVCSTPLRRSAELTFASASEEGGYEPRHVLSYRRLSTLVLLNYVHRILCYDLSALCDPSLYSIVHTLSDVPLGSDRS